jgi:glycosyltransferase involved in cell wall biosynthesis
MPVAPQSILIGIPSFRRPDGLRNLLASLESQEGVDTEHIEVFVADNDSRGRDAKQVCQDLADGFRWPLECRVVNEPGISAARNAILGRARDGAFQFIAMIDDDEIASPAWLRELLRTQDRFEADVVGGPLYFAFETDPSTSVLRCGLFETPTWNEQVVRIVDATNNLLLSCGSLACADWPQFHPAFGLTGGEDREFFTRLAKHEFRFAWSPGAAATETVPAARLRPAWILRRSFRVGNSDFRISYLHGGAAGAGVSLAKALTLLLSAPATALLLLVPSRRLWIVTKWSRSIGKIAGLFGLKYSEYGRSAIAGT